MNTGLSRPIARQICWPISDVVRRIVVFRVIIAAAGGAAHLPGMIAAHTWLPVLGVPILTKALKGIDSLLSIAQMPAGVAVGTLAIGEAGAKNAGLLAASIIGLNDPAVRRRVEAFRRKQTKTVLRQRLP